MEYFHNGCGIIPQYRPGCGSIRSQGGKRRGQTEVTARSGNGAARKPATGKRTSRHGKMRYSQIPAPASRLFRMPGGPELPQPRFPVGRSKKKDPARGLFKRCGFHPKKGSAPVSEAICEGCRPRLYGESLHVRKAQIPPPSRFSPSPGNRIPMGWAKIKRAPPV